MSEPDLLRTVRPLIADWLGPDAERVGPDDNLIEQGLDSIRLMTVSAALRRAGIRLTFAELARTPTLHAWEELLAERSPSPGSRTQEPSEERSERASADDETLPFDLALMQHASDITMAAYRHAIPRVEAGMRPSDIGRLMNQATVALGGDAPALDEEQDDDETDERADDEPVDEDEDEYLDEDEDEYDEADDDEDDTDHARSPRRSRSAAPVGGR